MLLRPQKKFSSVERQKNIQALDKEVFDICIIGGGITGAGTARDAASRGMRVCLIEQSDFASGTSSRSSKLIHGGIRYLENMEFGLVFEALSERHVLFEIAPHLVHPLTFVLPLYKSGRVGMFKMGLGMWLYDALALFHAPKFHERLSDEDTIYRLPALRHQELLGSYLYSDAYMDDDRLVIETLRSADAYGTVAVNYVKAGRGKFDQKGKLESLELTDQISGKTTSVRAKHFISTVGPWTDQFAETLIEWKSVLRPSKGIHFIIKREKLPLLDAVVMATSADNRIVFAIPRNEIVIIGTTDTDFKDDPSSVHSERLDVEYLLGVVQNYFPKARIQESDIISTYSGVRPLVHDGSATESKTSREHVVMHTPQNITFVAGGKYTTYRRMARDIMEEVLRKEFSLEKRIQFSRNQTRDPINPLVTGEKLNEAIAQSPFWAHEYGLLENQTKLLAERHGAEGLEILEEGRRRGLKSPWEMEAVFASQQTMCLHLRDFMLRRSPLFLTTYDHGLKLLDQIAKVFQQEHGWSDAQVLEEKALYQKHLEFEMGWKNEKRNTV